MRELLFIFGWLAIIGLKILIDWYQIVKLKKSPRHGLELILWIAFGMAWMAFVGGVNKQSETPYTLELLTFQAGSFAVLFNGPLNKARGLDWNYLGDGPYDTIWKKSGNQTYTWFQIICGGLALAGVWWIFQDLKYFV